MGTFEQTRCSGSSSQSNHGFQLQSQASDSENPSTRENSISDMVAFVEIMSLEEVWEQSGEEDDEVMANDEPFNLETCNRYLNACARSGSLEGIHIMLKTMRERNVEPNYVSYSILCKALVPTGNTAEIQSIMDSFETHGGELDEYWYAALLSACLVSNPPSAHVAKRAFYDMVDRGLRVKRVKALFKKALGHEVFAHLLQTLKVKRRYPNVPRLPGDRSCCARATDRDQQQLLGNPLSAHCVVNGGFVGHAVGHSREMPPTLSTPMVGSVVENCRLGNAICGSYPAREEMPMRTDFAPGTSSGEVGRPLSCRSGDYLARGSEYGCHTMAYNVSSVNSSAHMNFTPTRFNSFAGAPVHILSDPSVTVVGCFEV